MLTRLVAAVAIMCCASTALTLWFYRPPRRLTTLELVSVGTQLEAIDPQYRYLLTDNRLTLTGDATGTSAFSSTVSPAIFRLESLYDYDAQTVVHMRKENYPGMSELLGAKFGLTEEGQKEGWRLIPGHSVTYGQATYDVVERDACKIATVYGSYLPQDELLKLDRDLWAIAMLQAPAVAEGDQADAEEVVQAQRIEDLDLDASVPELVARANASEAGSIEDFSRGDWGFSFAADMHTDGLVFVSVPNDLGWHVTVDGQEVRPLDSNGLMLLPLTQGTHAVEARFVTPGATVGIAISAISCIVLVALVLVQIKRR